MTTDTTEKGLEIHISKYLVDVNNFILRPNTSYDNVTCLDAELLFQFLEATQPKAVAKIKTYHKDLYEQKILKRLNDQIQAKGIIEVLRKGITDGFTDTRLMLFYDKPVSAYNTDANALYKANLFSVMRQVYFSPNDKKSLDMMIFINGIPVISFELKNELTKQTSESIADILLNTLQEYKDEIKKIDFKVDISRLKNDIASETDKLF